MALGVWTKKQKEGEKEKEKKGQINLIEDQQIFWKTKEMIGVRVELLLPKKRITQINQH